MRLHLIEFSHCSDKTVEKLY